MRFFKALILVAVAACGAPVEPLSNSDELGTMQQNLACAQLGANCDPFSKLTCQCLLPGASCQDGDCLCNKGLVPNPTNTGCVESWVCGNGIVETGEACDDGNAASGDGCSSSCYVEIGWHCHSLLNGQSMCTPVCGDGRVLGSEACDDGNLVGQDGCSAHCKVEEYWTCSGSPSQCSPTTCNQDSDCYGPGEICGYCLEGRCTNCGYGGLACCYHPEPSIHWQCFGSPGTCTKDSDCSFAAGYACNTTLGRCYPEIYADSCFDVDQ